LVNDLSDCRVLVVDDVKSNVDLLVETLRGDYKLSVALGGEDALRSIARNRPDLVLLDIMMPDLDGYEICRRLRAVEATRELPIMFLSSLEDAKDKAHGFEVGGNDYLTKPFEVLEVKARVKSLLKAKIYADAVRAAAERDLRIAREIQTGLLPADIRAQTEGTGLDVHALLEPARQVGGDLFEVRRMNDGRVLVAVGDVSGKGIPASIFMAVTTTILRSMARQGHDPEEILRRLNDELLDQNPRGMFVTLDVSSETIELASGDTFVLFTDGVSEAFGPAGDLFGEERLIAHLAASSARSVREITSGVLEAVRHFAGDARQSDDITVVAARWTG
jgi:sigma-B regulation protein RsbU (phosphoserine phosphatase)